MNSHQNHGKNLSKLKPPIMDQQEQYFDIIKNYGSRKGKKDNTSHSSPKNAQKISQKYKSAQESIPKEKPIKKKRKGPKKYSAKSLSKRQIASRHIDRLQNNSEEQQQIVLWRQLWRSQIQQFNNAEDYELVKIFDEPQEQPLQVCLPEEKRQMGIVIPSQTAQQKEQIKQSVGKHEINPEQFMFNHYLNYQSSLYNQIQQSQDFFFEDIGSNYK